MTSIDDLRNLADQLEGCAQSSEDAQLSPYSTGLLLAVIRALGEGDEMAGQTIVERGFRIVVGDVEDESEETLGSASEIAIAQAMFNEAARQKTDRKIRLKRGAVVLGETR